MKILITGAGGFMGKHLIDFFLEKDFEVCGTYYNPSCNLNEINEKAELIELDVRDKSRFSWVLDKIKPDRIYHLAAQSLPTVSWRDPGYTMEVNGIGTINLFENVRSLNLDPKILVACSSAQYGYVTEEEVPVKESKNFKPLHPYGVSKVCQELLSYQYFKCYGMKSVNARIFNTTGPGKRNDVCSDFTKRIVEIEKGKREFLPVGNLETRRPICDVRDLIEGFWLATEKGKVGESYNLSGDKVYMIKELLDKIMKMSDAKFEVKQDKNLIRPTDEPIIFGDSGKFIKDTGWEQKIDIEKTLGDMLEYWRKDV